MQEAKTKVYQIATVPYFAQQKEGYCHGKYERGLHSRPEARAGETRDVIDVLLDL